MSGFRPGRQCNWREDVHLRAYTNGREARESLSAGKARTMKTAGKIEVLFVAGFGPIVREMTTSRKLYNDALGIPFKEESNGYLHTEALQGAKTFALWPLPQAAHSCFGSDSWPEDVPVPQAWLEFDVQSVESATAAL